MSTQEDTAQSLSDLVRDAFIASKPGPSEVTDAAAKAVYGYLFHALASGDPAEHVGEAVAGSIAAGKKTGDVFWHVVRGAVVGVVHAGLGRQLELEPLIAVATQRSMLDVDKLGGDFGAAAIGSVEGAIVAADELGLSEETLGSAAATAALETSLDLPEGSHEKVHHLVTRRVMGIAITVPRRLMLDEHHE